MYTFAVVCVLSKRYISMINIIDIVDIMAKAVCFRSQKVFFPDNFQ